MSGIHVPVFVLALLVSGGCTASRASSLSPYVADAASADADCPHSDAGPVARPGPCGSHSAGPARDGGVWACASSADCLDGGLYSPLYAINCLAGACVFDGCLSDADCKTGQACACPYEFLSGWRALGNACISTGCRTNSDCPASEVCSPSVDRYCGPSAVTTATRAPTRA